MRRSSGSDGIDERVVMSAKTVEYSTRFIIQRPSTYNAVLLHVGALVEGHVLDALVAPPQCQQNAL